MKGLSKSAWGWAVLLAAALGAAAWLQAAQHTINVGTAANSGDGDTIRQAFQKVNSNFTEVYQFASNGLPANTFWIQTTNGTWRSNLFGAEVPSVPTPATNTLALYVKDKSGVSALYFKDDVGTETEVGSGGVASNAIANLDGLGTNTTIRGWMRNEGPVTNTVNTHLTNVDNGGWLLQRGAFTNLGLFRQGGTATFSNVTTFQADVSVDAEVTVTGGITTTVGGGTFAGGGTFTGPLSANGGATVVSFLNIPNGAAPTTDAFGEIAGDNNAWAASRGAAQFYDGTANTYLVGTLASDTPANGQVAKWNTGGTITWEDDIAGSGSGQFYNFNASQFTTNLGTPVVVWIPEGALLTNTVFKGFTNHGLTVLTGVLNGGALTNLGVFRQGAAAHFSNNITVLGTSDLQSAVTISGDPLTIGDDVRVFLQGPEVSATMHGETNYLTFTIGDGSPNGEMRKISPSNTVDHLEQHKWNFGQTVTGSNGFESVSATVPGYMRIASTNGKYFQMEAERNQGSNVVTLTPDNALPGVLYVVTVSGNTNRITNTAGFGTVGQVLTATSSGVNWSNAAAGSGDITAVGDVASGAAFDGTAGNSLQFEGATADGFEVSLTSEDPAADSTVTLPKHATGDVPVVVHRLGGRAGVTNSTTEFEVLNYTIPGGMLGTNKALNVRLGGLWAGADASKTNRVRIYLGGTTVYDDQGYIPVAAATFPWAMDFDLQANDSQTANSLVGFASSGANGTTAGFGDLANDEVATDTVIVGTSTEGTGTNVALRVTFTLSAADAGYWFERRSGIVMLK